MRCARYGAATILNMIILQNSWVDFGSYLETHRALGTVNIRSFFSVSDSFTLYRPTVVHKHDLLRLGASGNLSVHFKLDGKSLGVQLATLRTNNVIFFYFIIKSKTKIKF